MSRIISSFFILLLVFVSVYAGQIDGLSKGIRTAEVTVAIRYVDKRFSDRNSLSLDKFRQYVKDALAQNGVVVFEDFTQPSDYNATITVEVSYLNFSKSSGGTWFAKGILSSRLITYTPRFTEDSFHTSVNLPFSKSTRAFKKEYEQWESTCLYELSSRFVEKVLKQGALLQHLTLAPGKPRKTKSRISKQKDPVLTRITIINPTTGKKTNNSHINVSGHIESAGKIRRVTLNDRLLKRKRGLAVVPRHVTAPGFTVQDTFHFQERVPLILGQNYIIIEVMDDAGQSSSNQVMVVRKPTKSMSAVLDKRTLPDLWIAIIGLNQYKSPDIPALKYARNDAVELSRFFDGQKALGIYKNLKRKLLINQNATLINIRAALGEFFIDAREDDLAIVFFAGHGVVDKVGATYLLAYDSDPDKLYSTALPMREFQNLLKHRIPPKRTLVLADACHSGGIGTGIRGTAEIIAEFHRLVRETEGKVIMTASREREFSREDDKKRHGLFTYYILEALKGSADHDNDNIITLRETYDYIYDKVKDASQGGQHPTLPAGGFDNEMPLAAIKKP